MYLGLVSAADREAASGRVIDPAAVGQRLKESRVNRGLTQVQLAEITGISARTIESYEKGTVPRGERLETLAGELGVWVGWILTGHEAADPQLEVLTERLDRLAERVTEMTQAVNVLAEVFGDFAALTADRGERLGELLQRRLPRPPTQITDPSEADESQPEPVQPTP